MQPPCQTHPTEMYVAGGVLQNLVGENWKWFILTNSWWSSGQTLSLFSFGLSPYFLIVFACTLCCRNSRFFTCVHYMPVNFSSYCNWHWIVYKVQLVSRLNADNNSYRKVYEIIIYTYMYFCRNITLTNDMSGKMDCKPTSYPYKVISVLGNGIQYTLM